MITVDMNYMPVSHEGKCFRHEKKEGEEQGEPMDVRDILVNALGSVAPGSPVPPQEKFQRGKLAIACFEQDEVAFTPGEVTIIKVAVANTYVSNVLIARIWNVLDPPGPDIEQVEAMEKSEA